MEDGIINKVASSSLVVFDLEQWIKAEECVVLDIQSQLYQGLVLKEKDFREYIKANDWSIYKGKQVAVMCSTDAILPVWAFMLVAIALKPYASRVVAGNGEDLMARVFQGLLDAMDWEVYRDAKVVVKGCSKVKVPVDTYVQAVWKLQSVASSVMFGEPCSTVPLYKKPKA